MTTLGTRRAGPGRALAMATIAVLAFGSVSGPVAAQASPVPASPAPSPAASPTVEEQLAAAQAEVAALQAENERLTGLIGSWSDLYDPMEADRQLLLELRKDLPDDRDAVVAYVDRIGRLGQEADPSRLGQAADRMRETLPAWLDWRFADYATAVERATAYLDSGAAGFDTDFLEFRNAALLLAATHLDAILTIADRIR